MEQDHGDSCWIAEMWEWHIGGRIVKWRVVGNVVELPPYLKTIVVFSTLHIERLLCPTSLMLIFLSATKETSFVRSKVIK